MTSNYNNNPNNTHKNTNYDNTTNENATTFSSDSFVKRVYKFVDYDYSTQGPCKSLITNNEGGYVALDDTSSYGGWYLFKPQTWKLNKIIESIQPLFQGKCTTLYHQGYAFRRSFENGGRDVFIPYKNALFYETNTIKGPIRLTLDPRETFEGSQFGRFYEVAYHKEDLLILHFKKQQTSTTSLSQESFDYYLACKGVNNINFLQNWKEKKYSSNKQRGAQDTYWVYDAFTFDTPKVAVFVCASTLEEAKEEAQLLFFDHAHISGDLHEHVYTCMPTWDALPSRRLQSAARLATHSLHQLTQIISFNTPLRGLFAGLPWFFHFWSRDELLSLSGLFSLVEKNKSLALHQTDSVDAQRLATIGEILHRYIHSISPKGELPSRFPKTTLEHADSLGILGKQVTRYISLLEDIDSLFVVLSAQELVFWFSQLHNALEHAKKSLQKENALFENKSCETWMDTQFMDDGRAGFRIEIQAGYVALYEAILLLAKKINSPLYSSLRVEHDALIQTIRTSFLRFDLDAKMIDGFFANGDVDQTLRPNVFIAFYLAPKLCSTNEWKKIFQAHVKKLWQPWGGLSTLSSKHFLFEPSYSGENNKSYHRGDSWYFVNALAAQSLYRVDSEEFAVFISKLLNAHAKDILELGFAGSASELSGALYQTGQGSLAQTWSVATFIELCTVLFNEE
ncbi:MAG: amylo-alpha-1,6-glucosidase [Candidatus Woesearchaeota archaeon]